MSLLGSLQFDITNSLKPKNLQKKKKEMCEINKTIK